MSRVALASFTAYSISAGIDEDGVGRALERDQLVGVDRPLGWLERGGHALDDHELLGRASGSRRAP